VQPGAGYCLPSPRLYSYMRNGDDSLAGFVTKHENFTPALTLGVFLPAPSFAHADHQPVMTGYVCRPTLSGRSKIPSPHHAQPNPSTPRTQPHPNQPSHTLNSPSQMRPKPANHQARQKPIPIGWPSWLSPSGCIGNAPAIRHFSYPTPTWLAHSRYHAYDFTALITTKYHGACAVNANK
jgi:hypothetical protein